MWRFKPFSQKEPAGLDGRTIDIGNLKIQVRNAIAEGGFSCVYIARDMINPSKQYALKHMICNDSESLDLVKKEISVLKLLKGHPNIVTLAASAIFDMGRTKEALLVMDYCEKSLVNVIENRGAGYFDEKQVLLIFRDVCNAVFAMHCQSPPIAHRDLKAENVLLGPDGAWKLCDFGSTSTNHKCFDKPEEMGIEEDTIRKHTTPAYRAPEMWDLYRREVISEKVDIWALGCLLFRICYFKSAFDGESKLQVLNGNYRIPELPKFSSSITNLIKDMLQSSPDARPDITQVWFRVNLLLPEELQKQMPDGSAVNDQFASTIFFEEGTGRRVNVVPKRSPPPPPSSREQSRHVSPQSGSEEKHPRSLGVSKKGGSAESLGSFWSTQHAQEAQLSVDKGPIFDDEPTMKTTSKFNHHGLEDYPRVVQKKSDQSISSKRSDDNLTEDFEIRFDQGDGFGRSKPTQQEYSRTKVSRNDNKAAMFQNETFNSFVAEFDTSKLNSVNNNTSNEISEKQKLEAEVERLKEELKRVNVEKAEITSKYEKLTAICRSQRQEIQELKQALSVATPSLQNSGSSKSQHTSPGPHSSTPPREKIEGSIFELQQGMFVNAASSPSPDAKPWQAFADDSKPQPTSRGSIQSKSVRTTSGRHNKSSVGGSDQLSFSQEPFMADSNPSVASRSGTHGSTSQRFTGNMADSNHSGASRAGAHGNTSQRFTGNDGNNTEKSNHPAGWAGF